MARNSVLSPYGKTFREAPRVRGQLSPHEMDLMYLSDTAESAGQEAISFATGRQLAIDTTMTNLVRAYRFEEQTFIADIVAPRRAVRSRIGRYKNRGKEALNIDVSDKLSDRGMANEIGFAATESTYLIDPHGLKGFCSDDEIDESGAIQCATELSILLKAATMLRQEIRVRNLADATSFTTNPANDWDTSAAVHMDVKDAVQSMKGRLGFRPNVIVLGDHICDEIVANANIKADIVASTSVADGRDYMRSMTGADLPRFRPWGMEMLQPDAQFNSASPGLAIANPLDRVWGDDGYLFRSDNETRTMTWALQLELLRETIVRWRTEDPAGWWYKIVYKRVVKEITPEAVHKLIDLT